MGDRRDQQTTKQSAPLPPAAFSISQVASRIQALLRAKKARRGKAGRASPREETVPLYPSAAIGNVIEITEKPRFLAGSRNSVVIRRHTAGNSTGPDGSRNPDGRHSRCNPASWEPLRPHIEAEVGASAAIKLRRPWQAAPNRSDDTGFRSQA